MSDLDQTVCSFPGPLARVAIDLVGNFRVL